MSQINLDKCPQCGAPYMSSPPPGTPPGKQYCYTCASSSGQGIPKVNDLDGLELQPLDEPSSSGVKKTRIPQVAPQKRGTAVAGVRPPSQKQKPGASPAPFMPVRDEFAPDYTASGIPQIAPRPGQFRRREGTDYIKPALVGAGVLAVVVGGYLMFGRSKPQNTQQASNLPAQKPATELKAPPVKETTPKPVAPSSPPTPAKPAVVAKPESGVEKKISDKEVADALGFGGARKSNERPTVPDAAKVAEAAPVPISPPSQDTKPAASTTAKVDLNDALGAGPRKKKNSKLDEEDEAPAAPVTAKKSEQAAPKADSKEGEKPAQEVAAGDFADPKAEEAKSAKPENDPGADVVIPGKEDPNNPGKKVSSLDLLGGNKDDDVAKKAELEKRDNPFAPKGPIAVTATAPTVMPIDLERIGGNDKEMSQSLSAILPNWRVRDSHFENSKFGVKHLNADNAIIISPMNDVLPAKLMSVVEIPANYAGKRPTLSFEVSSPTMNKGWILAVRAMNVELVAKTKVQSRKDQEWLPVTVDLSPLAGKHFDLQIEVYSAIKGNTKKLKDEAGCIKNVRIEWAGMKK